MDIPFTTEVSCLLLSHGRPLCMSVSVSESQWLDTGLNVETELEVFHSLNNNIF